MKPHLTFNIKHSTFLGLIPPVLPHPSHPPLHPHRAAFCEIAGDPSACFHPEPAKGWAWGGRGAGGVRRSQLEHAARDRDGGGGDHGRADPAAVIAVVGAAGGSARRGRAWRRRCVIASNTYSATRH